MATYLFTGSSIGVRKVITLIPGGNPPNGSGLSQAVIRVGLSPSKLLSQQFEGFSPEAIAAAWNQSEDSVIREITATVDGGGVSFTHTVIGEDFEIYVTVDGTVTVLATEHQQLTFQNNAMGGTFRLTFAGQQTGNITYVVNNADTTADNIQAALEALAAIQIGDINVYPKEIPATLTTQAYLSTTEFIIAFGGQYVGLSLNLLEVDFTNLTGGNAAVVITTTQEGNVGTDEVQQLTLSGYGSSTITQNEFQTVTLLGNVIGGTFTLSVAGYGTTGPIPYNATAAQVQTALSAIVGVGNVVCSMGPAPAISIWCVFQGALAGTNIQQMIGNPGNLTLGSSADFTVAQAVNGAAGTNLIRSFAKPAQLNTNDLANYVMYFKNGTTGASLVRTALIPGNSSTSAITAALLGEWDYISGNTAADLDYGNGPGVIFSSDMLTVSGSLTAGTVTVERKNQSYNTSQLFMVLMPANPSQGNPPPTYDNIGTTSQQPVAATAETQLVQPTGTIPSTGNLYITVDGQTTEAISLNQFAGNFTSLAGAVQTELNKLYRVTNYAPPAQITFNSWQRASNGVESVFKKQIISYPVTESSLRASFNNAALSTIIPPNPVNSSRLSLTWVGISDSYGSVDPSLAGIHRWMSDSYTRGLANTLAPTVITSAITTYAQLATKLNELLTWWNNANYGNRVEPVYVQYNPANTSGALATYAHFDVRFSNWPVVGTNYPAMSWSYTPQGTNAAQVMVLTVTEGGQVTIPNITGGTFDLGFSRPDQTLTWVTGIPYNTTAANMQGLINGILGAGAVVCSGGPILQSSITITFAGSWAKKAVNPTLFRLSFEGLFAGSFSQEIIRPSRTPERVDNCYDFTIIPGRGTLALNKNSSWSNSAQDCNWGQFNIALPGLGRLQSDYFRWTDCTALDIENVINEMFSKDVCRVYQVVHSQEWATIPNVYGSPPTYNQKVWYYKDVFRIVFHSEFANPATITDVEFVLPAVTGGTNQNPAVVSPFAFMTNETGNNADDFYNESYRVFTAFLLAHNTGNPLHRINIVPSAVDSQLLTFRYKLLQNYIANIYTEGSGSVNTARAIRSEFPVDMQVRFVWERRFRSGVQDGNTSAQSLPLATTEWLDWDSPSESFYNALTSMQQLGTNMPDFFGANNVTVVGGLRNSHLSESYQTGQAYDSYQDLRVTLTGRWSRLPLDEYEYFLSMELAQGSVLAGMPQSGDSQQFNLPLPWSDVVARPIPPLVSERQRLTANLSGLSANISIGYNGAYIDITPETTAQQVETLLNSLSTLGQLPANASNMVPKKWGKAVTVYGSTVGGSPLEIEFSGYGFQYTPANQVRYSILPDGSSIMSLVTLTEGVSLRPEIQTVALTGRPRSGTFRLNYNGNNTGTLARTLTASALQTELQALAGIGNGNVVCSGGPLMDASETATQGAITCTFSSSLGNIAQLTSNSASFVNSFILVTKTRRGGSEGSLLIKEITRGNGPFFWDSPDNWREISTGARQVPSSQDTAIVDDTQTAIKYGLRQRSPFLVQSIGGGTRLMHGYRRRVFLNGMKVWLYAKAGGTLPVGLTAGYYYIRNAQTDGTFEISATPTGPLIGISDAGNGEFFMEVRELTLLVYSRFAGAQIGLPNRRSGGAEEYLARYLEMGFKQIDLGIDEGPGMSLGRFNTIDQPVANKIRIRRTGSSSNGDLPAVLLLTNNGTVELEMENGEVGIAVYPDETSLLEKITQNAGLLLVSNTIVEDKIYNNFGAQTNVVRSTVNGELRIQT